MAYRIFLLAFALVGLALAAAEDAQPRKEFNLELTWGQHNPVGRSSRDMFLINGQTPGPLIEADQDDWMVVRVDNQSPFNVTLHFHGKNEFPVQGAPTVNDRMSHRHRNAGYSVV